MQGTAQKQKKSVNKEQINPTYHKDEVEEKNQKFNNRRGTPHLPSFFLSRWWRRWINFRKSKSRKRKYFRNLKTTFSGAVERAKTGKKMSEAPFFCRWLILCSLLSRPAKSRKKWVTIYQQRAQIWTIFCLKGNVTENNYANT